MNHKNDMVVACVCTQSCLTLCGSMDCSLPGSSGRREQSARQEYWSRLPFPSPAGLPDPGIQPTSRVSRIGRQILYQQRHLGSPHITK